MKKEILNLFVNKYNRTGCPLVFENPIEQKGYTIASDARVMVWFKTEVPGTFKEELKPDLNNFIHFYSNYNLEIKYIDIEKLLSNPPLVDEEKGSDKQIKCNECDGDGSVDAEYDGRKQTYTISCDCPVCDGSGKVDDEDMVRTGKQIVPKDYAVEINGFLFSYEIANTLLKTMQILKAESCIQLSQNKCFGNIFLIGDVYVLLITKVRS